MLPLLLFSASVGIIIVGGLPSLPPLLTLLLPVLVLLLLCYFPSLRQSRFISRYGSMALAIMLGMAWGIFHGHGILDRSLDAKWVGQELLVQGRVVDLPVHNEQTQSLVLVVTHMESLDGVIAANELPKKIRLSWFEPSVRLVSGEQWQFLVQLKQPRGFVNPGGFDYQGWLLRRDIGATGTIRKHNTINKRLASASRLDVDYWRYQIREWMLTTTESEWRGIALALMIGDRSLIPAEHWQILQRTGTNHLIAISGMHVSFVAVLAFFTGMSLGRLVLLINDRYSPIRFACCCSVGAAVVYALLAGLSLPTRRAIIMVLVAQLVVLFRRSFRSRDALLLAWFLVLMDDPLAAYDPGLWLSFGAVAVLLMTFSGYLFLNEKHYPGKSLVRAQTAIFFGLFVPLVLLIHSVSLTAPLANLVAIPLVTMWVVPCLLLALPLQHFLADFSVRVLEWGLFGIDLLIRWDELLLTLAAGKLNPIVSLSIPQAALAVVASFFWLLPRGLPGRWMSLPLFSLAIFLPVEQRAPLQLTFLDVGQGLAVVIKTPSHTLLYDTGPQFSDNFDAGSAIVVPYLHRSGIHTLDALVVSHNDNDHIGGLAGVLEGVAVSQLLWGDMTSIDIPTEYPAYAAISESCHDQPPRMLDEVEISFIAVPPALTTRSNNYSCILKVRYGDQRFILTGDAEREVETWLVEQQAIPAPVTLLVAGHHGSRTSSTAAFVDYLRPAMVIFSAGYQSRYGHPHPDVVARFEQVGSRPFNTATGGAIVITLDRHHRISTREYREFARRYWHPRQPE